MSEQLNKITFLVPAEFAHTSRNSLSRTTAAALPMIETQPDLLYMRSVLVSTGSNKNDDVFLPEEMWRARFSPTLKFVNWEHNSGREATTQELASNPKQVVVGNQIIGVMYNSFVTDENGVIIDEEKVEASDFKIPRNFHIVDEAVIYKGAFPTVAARIEKGANEGNLFVSMEAYFSGYDYLVGNKVVARNEETAFLEQRLRANGGDGIFGSNSVKRVLRGIVFGGKGIVERPANEPSIIQSVTHEPIAASIITNKVIASNVIGDLGNMEESIVMSDKAKATEVAPQSGPSFNDYKAVTQELADTRVELKSTASKLEEAKVELETAKAEQDAIKSALVKGGKVLEEALPGISDKLAQADVSQLFSLVADSVKDISTQASEKIAAAEKEKAAAIEALAAIEAKVRAGERLSRIQSELSLAAADGDDDETVAAKLTQATKIADETKSLDDEAFASHLEGLKSLLSVALMHGDKMDKDKKGKKDDEDEDKDMKDKKDAKAGEDSDEGITDASVLDAVKAQASVSAGADTSGEGATLNLDKAYAGLVGSLINSRRSEDKDN